MRSDLVKRLERLESVRSDRLHVFAATRDETGILRVREHVQAEGEKACAFLERARDAIRAQLGGSVVVGSPEDARL